MGECVRIAPSILSADFGALRDAIALAADAGADMIHVDVMDGHFVPNLTIGPPVLRSMKAYCSLPLDVHLMIDNADTVVEWYLDAGADLVTVHVEACTHLDRVVSTIKEAGIQAGVALNPATSADTLSEVLGETDLILVMSVNPGFGGQTFIHSSLDKVRKIVSMCEKAGASPLISMDGGVNMETAPSAVKAGVRMLVAGEAIFRAEDPSAAIPALRERALIGLA